MASSADFRTFEYDGVCLGEAMAVNDVKRFDIDGETWYLMGLHMNRGALYYALSRDGMEFGPVHTLTESQSAADAYIVAIGWVVDGDRVLGCLYGAGAVPALNENRLFAKWLQKRVVFATENGATYEADAAMGPDAQRISLPQGAHSGAFHVYAEDGTTLLFSSETVTIRSGETWSVSPAATQS